MTGYGKRLDRSPRSQPSARLLSLGFVPERSFATNRTALTARHVAHFGCPPSRIEGFAPLFAKFGVTIEPLSVDGCSLFEARRWANLPAQCISGRTARLIGRIVIAPRATPGCGAVRTIVGNLGQRLDEPVRKHSLCPDRLAHELLRKRDALIYLHLPERPMLQS